MKHANLICVLILGMCYQHALLARDVSEYLRTELRTEKSIFSSEEPITISGYMENLTSSTQEWARFGATSSSIGLPTVTFIRVPEGDSFSIAVGLYGESWNSWRQTPSGLLPPRSKIPLLRGDLRALITHAREHCERSLGIDIRWSAPENLSTKKHYEDIIRWSDRFLSAGGIFDVSLKAQADSNVIRITVEKKAQQGARANALTGPAISHDGLPLHSSFSFEEDRLCVPARGSSLTLGKMKTPATPLEAYKAIIDELAFETRASGAASHIKSDRIYSAAPAHARFNAFVQSLSPQQRKLLSDMLLEERHGAIHDVLAVLSWWTSCRDVGLTFRGEPMPLELSGMGLHGDYVGRVDDWPWPTRKNA